MLVVDHTGGLRRGSRAGPRTRRLGSGAVRPGSSRVRGSYEDDLVRVNAVAGRQPWPIAVTQSLETDRCASLAKRSADRVAFAQAAVEADREAAGGVVT